MKKCSKCGEEKDLTEYWSGRNQCKQCRLLIQKAERAITGNARGKKYYQNNKDKILKYHREKYLESTTFINERNKKWRMSNRAKIVAYGIKRRAQISNATPSWMTEDDYWLMEQAYIHAKEQTLRHGILFHVDHIIPLQGKNVCGLHCPDNLQVIPWYENLRKSNKYTPKSV